MCFGNLEAQVIFVVIDLRVGRGEPTEGDIRRLATLSFKNLLECLSVEVERSVGTGKMLQGAELTVLADRDGGWWKEAVGLSEARNTLVHSGWNPSRQRGAIEDIRPARADKFVRVKFTKTELEAFAWRCDELERVLFQARMSANLLPS
jgi:hypothetical protein